MKLLQRSLIVLMMGGLAVSSVFWYSSAQSKLTKGQVLTALNAQKDASGRRTTIAQRNALVIKFVRNQGVNFALTEEAERDLREAGATDELIAAIRNNSPSPPRTNPPATPRPTPISTPSTSNGSGYTLNLGNNVRLEMVLIPSGSFQMGSNDGEADEKPVHRVTISRDFYLGKYEVTQAQWQAVMGNNPSRFKGDNLPVEQVSWEDVQDFLRKLNAKGEGKYRLPSEAEWEYAARAGSTTKYSYGDGEGSLGDYGWYAANSGGTTHPVGTKQANEWGLYDMHGNVWEWCNDWYGDYPSKAVTDPSGASSGSNRVDRGGGWGNGAAGLRSAYRFSLTPSYRHGGLGFRLLRE